MNILHVNANKLVVGPRYTIQRKNIQFTGTYSGRDLFGGIVFRNVVYNDGTKIKLINIPFITIIGASVVVHPYLISELNYEINHF